MVSWAMLEIAFLASAAVNIVGVLVFSKGLTNEAFISAYPALFGKEGMIGIMLWGAAYLSAVPSLRPGREKQPLMYAVFCAEKIFYTATWVRWCLLQEPSASQALRDLLAKDVLAGVFYAIYGLNDFAFAIVFGLATLKSLGEKGGRPADAAVTRSDDDFYH